MVSARLVLVSVLCLGCGGAFAQMPASPPPSHVVARPSKVTHAHPRAPHHTPRHASHHPRSDHQVAAKPEARVKKAAKPEAARRPAHPAPPPPDPHIGTSTGLKLPRFASLRADEVNLRLGPGDRYPVEWIYKRRGLPVEIIREFDVWRLVVVADGTKGWAHEATLMGRRDFIVTGAEHSLRAEPRDAARAVARLKPGVVGRLADCPAHSAWCHVQVSDYRGWIKRQDIWGVLPGETVAPG